MRLIVISLEQSDLFINWSQDENWKLIQLNAWHEFLAKLLRFSRQENLSDQKMNILLIYVQKPEHFEYSF